MIGPSRIKIRMHIFIAAISSLVVFFCGSGIASSFPFRVVAPGDILPPLSFTSVADNSAITVESLKGNPVALIFWGADIDTKKDRSLKTFAATEAILPFLDERKIKVLLVNAQGDSKCIGCFIPSSLQ